MVSFVGGLIEPSIRRRLLGPWLRFASLRLLRASQALRFSEISAMASSIVFTQSGMVKSTALASSWPSTAFVLPRPFDETCPHFADEDERSVVEVTHLQKLPRQRQLEQRANSSPGDDRRRRNAIMKW
jgi:hypothetical protein